MISKIFSNFSAKKFYQNCWNCKSPHQKDGSHFFCSACHKIQSPSCASFFDLFNIDKSYEIDKNILESTYKHHQKNVHPDKFYQATPTEQEISEEVSTCVNQGYEILKNSIKRGEYLLSLFKHKADEAVDQTFIAKVLDIHEQIEESSDVKELQELWDQVSQEMNLEEARLSNYLKIENGDVVNPIEAAKSISKMKYYQRMKDLLNEKIPFQ